MAAKTKAALSSVVSNAPDRFQPRVTQTLNTDSITGDISGEVMGHQHLLNLPKTREWRAVVELLVGGADVAAIAAATSQAAEKSMIEASADPAVRHSFFLLTQIPIAAGNADFVRALRRLGLRVSDEPSLVDLGIAMMGAIDSFITRQGIRTDYGEIAQLATVECVQAVIGRDIDDFFGERERLRTSLARFSDSRYFAYLARDFFGRLTRRHFSFYLSRELASHIGNGRRFPSLLEHEDFEHALDLHCQEATRIIKEFSASWFHKHTSQGGIDPEIAGKFVHAAAGKIRDELAKRAPVHA